MSCRELPTVQQWLEDVLGECGPGLKSVGADVLETEILG